MFTTDQKRYHQYRVTTHINLPASNDGMGWSDLNALKYDSVTDAYDGIVGYITKMIESANTLKTIYTESVLQSAELSKYQKQIKLFDTFIKKSDSMKTAIMKDYAEVTKLVVTFNSIRCQIEDLRKEYTKLKPEMEKDDGVNKLIQSQRIYKKIESLTKNIDNIRLKLNKYKIMFTILLKGLPTQILHYIGQQPILEPLINFALEIEKLREITNMDMGNDKLTIAFNAVRDKLKKLSIPGENLKDTDILITHPTILVDFIRYVHKKKLPPKIKKEDDDDKMDVDDDKKDDDKKIIKKADDDDKMDDDDDDDKKYDDKKIIKKEDDDNKKYDDKKIIKKEDDDNKKYDDEKNDESNKKDDDDSKKYDDNQKKDDDIKNYESNKKDDGDKKDYSYYEFEENIDNEDEYYEDTYNNDASTSKPEIEKTIMPQNDFENLYIYYYETNFKTKHRPLNIVPIVNIQHLLCFDKYDKTKSITLMDVYFEFLHELNPNRITMLQALTLDALDTENSHIRLIHTLLRIKYITYIMSGFKSKDFGDIIVELASTQPPNDSLFKCTDKTISKIAYIMTEMYIGTTPMVRKIIIHRIKQGEAQSDEKLNDKLVYPCISNTESRISIFTSGNNINNMIVVTFSDKININDIETYVNNKNRVYPIAVDDGNSNLKAQLESRQEQKKELALKTISKFNLKSRNAQYTRPVNNYRKTYIEITKNGIIMSQLQTEDDILQLKQRDQPIKILIHPGFGETTQLAEGDPNITPFIKLKSEKTQLNQISIDDLYQMTTKNIFNIKSFLNTWQFNLFKYDNNNVNRFINQFLDILFYDTFFYEDVDVMSKYKEITYEMEARSGFPGNDFEDDRDLIIITTLIHYYLKQNKIKEFHEMVKSKLYITGVVTDNNSLVAYYAIHSGDNFNIPTNLFIDNYKSAIINEYDDTGYLLLNSNILLYFGDLVAPGKFIEFISTKNAKLVERSG
jgi:hypothetical protein